MRGTAVRHEWQGEEGLGEKNVGRLAGERVKEETSKWRCLVCRAVVPVRTSWPWHVSHAGAAPSAPRASAERQKFLKGKSIGRGGRVERLFILTDCCSICLSLSRVYERAI